LALIRKEQMGRKENIRDKIEQELIEKGDVNTLRAIRKQWGRKQKNKSAVKKAIKKKEEKREEKTIDAVIEEGLNELKTRTDGLSVENIADSLIRNAGKISKVASEFGVSYNTVDEKIKKSKLLKDVLNGIRETILDNVEDVLYTRIVEKQDSIAAMFWLKCMGKHRGWNEKGDDKGNEKRPIYVKIMPVGFNAPERVIKPDNIKALEKAKPALKGKKGRPRKEITVGIERLNGTEEDFDEATC